jgi:hypothetical protein
MSKRTINATSFTPKYDEREDRIRLSINYEELQNRADFMISRAFVLKLFPVLDEYMMKFYESEVVLQKNFKQEIRENINQGSSTAVADENNLALYKQEDELLLDVSFTYIGTNKKTQVLFHSQNTEAKVEFDGETMKQVFTVIKSALPFFSWGISHNF